jgi:hypothetical protein
MVIVGSGSSTSRYLKTDYPFTEGLTAGTQTQTGRESNLTPQEDSKIFSKDRIGL